MNVIRIRLSIERLGNHEPRNVWMSLNYVDKPTISNIIEQIKQNFIDKKSIDYIEIKLSLDGYYLPEFESSKLIRENDLINVRIQQKPKQPREECTKSKTILKNFFDTQIKQAQELNSKKMKKIETENVPQVDKIVEKSSEFIPTNEKTNIIPSTVDLDQIAAKINSTGKEKWKKSSKKQTGPNHIKFSSSDETTPDPKSMSDKMEKRQQYPKQQQHDSNQSEKASVLLESDKSFFKIQDRKSLVNFLKKFDDEKLSPPLDKKYANNFGEDNMNILIENNKNEIESSEDNMKFVESFELKEINFEKLEKLDQNPMIGEKIAFQVLEISENFTPEISGFKIGKVVELNEKDNEIIVEMFGRYNSVLRRKNKLNVVLSSDEELDEELDVQKIDETEITDLENPDLVKLNFDDIQNIRKLPKNFE